MWKADSWRWSLQVSPEALWTQTQQSCCLVTCLMIIFYLFLYKPDVFSCHCETWSASFADFVKTCYGFLKILVTIFGLWKPNSLSIDHLNCALIIYITISHCTGVCNSTKTMFRSCVPEGRVGKDSSVQVTRQPKKVSCTICIKIRFNYLNEGGLLTFLISLVYFTNKSELLHPVVSGSRLVADVYLGWYGSRNCITEIQ